MAPLSRKRRNATLQDSLRAVAPLIGLGIQFALLIAIGVFAGWWIDGRYGVAPWGTLFGGIIGIAIGFYHFIRAALASGRRKDGDRDAR